MTTMNRPFAIDAPPRREQSRSTPAVASGALVAVLIATACTVLVLDASLTPEQRIAVLTQWQMFP